MIDVFLKTYLFLPIIKFKNMIIDICFIESLIFDTILLLFVHKFETLKYK